MLLNKAHWKTSLDNYYYPINKIKTVNPAISLDHCFTADEIKLIISSNHNDVFPAIVGESSKSDKAFVETVRKSDVKFLTNFIVFDWLYEKLATYVNEINKINFDKTLYGIQPLQYTEYDSSVNAFYSTHTDALFNNKDALRRSLSFTLQLSDPSEYDGGEVLIYYVDKTFTSNKNLGSITFFDSVAMHEVTPVTSGSRKSLVGWVLGPRI